MLALHYSMLSGTFKNTDNYPMRIIPGKKCSDSSRLTSEFGNGVLGIEIMIMIGINNHTEYHEYDRMSRSDGNLHMPT